MQIGGMYTIDFARVSKIPKFEVTIKNGDIKRTIKLILLKNSEVLNLNNYTVVVAAKKTDGKDIFNDIKIIDAESGICEVEITEQMLALGMDLPCEIVLYNSDGVVASSSNFVISKISSLKNEESIISSSEFTALTKALSDVTYVKSTLDNKANKDEIFSMSNMGQDIKEAMTGGSVAVVGKNSVLKENIVDNQVTPQKTSFIKVSESINKFNKNSITKNGYIDYRTGNWIENSSFAESDYIKINLKTNLIKNYASHVVFYDSTYKFLIGYDSPGNSAISIPSDAYYIRTSCNLSQLDSFMLVFNTTLPPTYVEFDEKYKLNNIQLDEQTTNKIESSYESSFKINKLDSIFYSSNNLIDESKIVLNKVPNINTGELEVNNVYSCTSFIKVTPNETYTDSTYYRKVFYDENEKYVSGLDNEFSFTVPEGVYYVIVCVKTDSIGKKTIQLNHGTRLLDYDEFCENIINKDNLPSTLQIKTKGKKAVFLGDSITDINHSSAITTYPTFIKNILELKEVVNYGISGSTIANVSSVVDNVDPYPMTERFLDMDNDADIVALFGLTNDWGRGLDPTTPEGENLGSSDMQPTLGDIYSRDKTTFSGALNYILDGLQTKYPNKLIIGIISPHRYNDTKLNTRGLKLKDYVDRAREIYELHSIPYLDLFKNGNFNPNNQANKNQWSMDYVHPNTNYHKNILAPRLANFILNQL